MQTRCLVSALLVTGLATVAALVTGNLIQAAESAAKLPGPDGRGGLGPTCAGFCWVSGGTDFTSALPPFGRKRDFADRASGPFMCVDHALVGIVDAAADLPKPAEPESRAIDPRKGIEARQVGVQAAEVAGGSAELDGLFDVAPSVVPVRLAAARDAQGEKGKQVYLKLCYVCHQPDGRGVPGIFPMLAQSDFLAADRSRAIRVVLRGLSGPVTVNGQTTNGVMPALGAELMDEQIADVLTYVFNAWENPGGAFTADQVEAIRNGKP